MHCILLFVGVLWWIHAQLAVYCWLSWHSRGSRHSYHCVLSWYDVLCHLNVLSSLRVIGVLSLSGMKCVVPRNVRSVVPSVHLSSKCSETLPALVVWIWHGRLTVVCVTRGGRASTGL